MQTSKARREQRIFLCQAAVKRDTTFFVQPIETMQSCFTRKQARSFSRGRTLRILCRAFQSTVRLSTAGLRTAASFFGFAGPDTQRERDASLPLHVQLSRCFFCPGKEARKSQACWNARRELNYKEVEILQRPSLRLACAREALLRSVLCTGARCRTSQKKLLIPGTVIYQL